METPNVPYAFELLLSELESQLKKTHEAAVHAMSNSNYEEAQKFLELAQRIKAFTDNIRGKREEWNNLLNDFDNTRKSGHRSRNRKLQKGMRTNEELYRIPILESLKELGGKAKIQDVLEKVHSKMKNYLKPIDYESINSDPKSPRWRNTAQWARFKLVQQGLMKNDSPKGIWEISEKGLEYLLSQGKSSKAQLF